MNFQIDNFEAVIFDMDGVLINSEPYYIEVEQYNFRKLGLNVTQEEHITYQGIATDKMWELVIKKHGLSKSVEELVEITNAMVTPYFQNLPTIEPMTNVVELIKYLSKKNIPLALASSSNLDIIEIVLQKTGLKKYFSEIVSSQIVGSSKPEPDIFLFTSEKLGILPKKCVVIEDSKNGIEAAKRAGMFCIAYSGPGFENQDQSQADLIISDFKELFEKGK